LNNIINTIEQEIAIHGVLSFHRFMELALYHPKFGYYEARNLSIGKSGDFFTSVSVGNLYGTLLAGQFCDWLSSLPAASVRIIETGAHDGRLALDILTYLSKYKHLANKIIEYCILEPSPQRRAWQQKTIGPSGHAVKWFEDWNQFEKHSVDGIIFSNELLDAFPAHRIRWDAFEKAWFEWGVAIVDEIFTWVKMTHTRKTATAMIEEDNRACGFELPGELLAVLPDGFSVDLCPDARQWWSQAAQRLRHGYLMTIDYGLEAEQFYEPQRAHGTLRGYRKHQLQSDVLAHPGAQDITTMVNFTAIKHAGEKAGLETVAYQSQSKFLTAILANHTGEFEAEFSKNPALVGQFKTLTHPDHLGRAFQVCVQKTSKS
jgi:SAM-dependent MidA family methyltransferase